MIIKRYIVPEYSQYLDVRSKQWNWRSCGIVSLFMTIAYWDPTLKQTDIPRLIKYGIATGAYREGIGWTHQGLLDMAIALGFAGKRLDLYKKENDAAFKTFLTHLKKGPVIVSTYKDFDPKKGGGHLIVATGYKEQNDKMTIFIADPDAQDRTSINYTITKAKLLKGWKRRFIAITPK